MTPLHAATLSGSVGAILTLLSTKCADVRTCVSDPDALHPLGQDGNSVFRFMLNATVSFVYP